MTITLDNYEAALTVLALRQFAQNQLSDAVNAIRSNDFKKGNECSDRGTKASEIADRIGN